MRSPLGDHCGYPAEPGPSVSRRTSGDQVGLPIIRSLETWRRPVPSARMTHGRWLVELIWRRRAIIEPSGDQTGSWKLDVELTRSGVRSHSAAPGRSV